MLLTWCGSLKINYTWIYTRKILEFFFLFEPIELSDMGFFLISFSLINNHQKVKVKIRNENSNRGSLAYQSYALYTSELYGIEYYFLQMVRVF